MTTDHYEVQVTARIRRQWMVRLGMWLIGRGTVEVRAGNRTLGKPIRFTVTTEEVEEEAEP